MVPGATTDSGATAVLSGRRPGDRTRAVGLINGGAVIGASFGTVYGLIGDGSRPELGTTIARIKGHRRLGRPLSVCLPEARLCRLLDPEQIHPAVRRMALDGDELARTLSSLCFVRAPIRESVARELPEHIVSRADGVPYLQSLDPGGLAGMGALMRRLWRDGVRYPAITSMNNSGEPEIVELSQAARFSHEHDLPALVRPAGARPRAQGSLTILEIGPHGVRAVRHGVIPVSVLQRLIEPPVEDELTEPADLPALDVPPGMLDGLSHHSACRAALLWLGARVPATAVRTTARLGLSHPWPALPGRLDELVRGRR